MRYSSTAFRVVEQLGNGSVAMLFIVVSLSVGCQQAMRTCESRKCDQGSESLRHQAAWMADGSFGIMVHYLITPQGETREEKTRELNRIVDAFDLDAFMSQFEATGADWLIFTIGQNTGYYCSPNAYLDRKLPGHTSQRDLPLEIGRRLHALNKKLIVYLPATCNWMPKEIQQVFEWDPENPDIYQKNYQAYLRCYSQQLGRYHDGWWFDGCYPEVHQGQWDWQPWIDACRTGNPDAVIAFCDGAFCVGRLDPVTPLQDYHGGETHIIEDGKIRTDFCCVNGSYQTPEGLIRVPGQEPQYYLPDAQFVQGVQWHALVPVDSSFCYPTVPNMHYSDAELLHLLGNCKSVKGAITFNLPIDLAGHIPDESVAQMQRISAELNTNESF